MLKILDIFIEWKVPMIVLILKCSVCVCVIGGGEGGRYVNGGGVWVCVYVCLFVVVVVVVIS